MSTGKMDSVTAKLFVLTVPSKKDNTKRYCVTIPGIYDIACRQSQGYGGTVSTCRVADIPVSRFTVARCEQTLNANMIAQRKAWCQDYYNQLSTYVFLMKAFGVVGGNELSYEIHVVLGGASNSDSFKTAKAFASFIHTWVHIPNLQTARTPDSEDDNGNTGISLSALMIYLSLW